MQLLELDDGQASLELRTDELESVIASLRGFGGFRRRRRASYDLVRARGSEFVLTNDWDEPCLLSRDAEGSQILRDIAQEFAGTESDGAAIYQSLSRG
jgi:hypothetical protein